MDVQKDLQSERVAHRVLHEAGRNGVCHCMMYRKLPFVHIIYHIWYMIYTMIITASASSHPEPTEDAYICHHIDSRSLSRRCRAIHCMQYMPFQPCKLTTNRQ